MLLNFIGVFFVDPNPIFVTYIYNVRSLQIVREIHGNTCLCIVKIGVEQQYGESPDT